MQGILIKNIIENHAPGVMDEARDHKRTQSWQRDKLCFKLQGKKMSWLWHLLKRPVLNSQGRSSLYLQASNRIIS